MKNLRFLVIALIAIILGACGSETSNTESNQESEVKEQDNLTELTYEELVEKAKEEGEVVVYGSSSPERMSGVIEAFENKYGIEVKYTTTNAGDIVNKLHAEHQSGNVQVDVIFQANSLINKEFIDSGYLAEIKYSLPEIAEEANALTVDNYITPMNVATAGILYDSSVIDKPESWEDLLDSSVSEIGIEDPAQNNTFIAILNVLRDEYGDDFIKELGKKLVIYDKITMVANNVMAKEIPVGFSMGSVGLPIINQASDSSVKYIDDLPVVGGINLYQGLVKEGSNNHAGLLLLNWTLSPEGQVAWNGNDMGKTPLKNIEIEGVEPAPDGLVEIDYARALEEREEILELLNSN